MNRTRTILVYEFISAGGLAQSEAIEPATHQSLLNQGTAMRDSLVVDLLAAGFEVTVADAGLAPMPPGFASAQVLSAAEATATDGVAWLARTAPDFDRVWAIAPETDGVLTRMGEAVGAAHWIGCAPAAIRIASSKSATRECLRAHGILTPESPPMPHPGPRSSPPGRPGSSNPTTVPAAKIPMCTPISPRHARPSPRPPPPGAP